MPSYLNRLSVTMVSWWLALRRFQARHMLLFDGAVAAIIVVPILEGLADEVSSAGRGMDGLGNGLVVVCAAALTVRRRFPVLAFAVSYGAVLVYLLLGYPFGPVIQLAALALYSVAAWSGGVTSVVVCLVALAGYLPLEFSRHWSGLGVSATLLITMAWLVMPWVVGAAVRTYRRARDEAAEAERSRHVYEERLRIAREVHDVVGHGLTVINMQARIALHVLEGRSCDEDVIETLRAISTVSGDALQELRAALAAEPRQADEHAPGLDRVANLVRAVNGAGALTVELNVHGERGHVPTQVDLVGYRVVQEALTNVLRHAGAARAVVRIGYEDRGVRVSISDDGRGGAAVPGRGLTGLRERVTALGGEFTAGPAAGGFEVHAVLPAGPPVPGGGRRRHVFAGRVTGGRA